MVFIQQKCRKKVFLVYVQFFWTNCWAYICGAQRTFNCLFINTDFPFTSKSCCIVSQWAWKMLHLLNAPIVFLLFSTYDEWKIKENQKRQNPFAYVNGASEEGRDNFSNPLFWPWLSPNQFVYTLVSHHQLMFNLSAPCRTPCEEDKALSLLQTADQRAGEGLSVQHLHQQRQTCAAGPPAAPLRKVRARSKFKHTHTELFTWGFHRGSYFKSHSFRYLYTENAFRENPICKGAGVQSNGQLKPRGWK